MTQEEEKVFVSTKIFDEKGEKIEELVHETIIRER